MNAADPLVGRTITGLLFVTVLAAPVRAAEEDVARPALRITQGSYSVYPEAYLSRYGHPWTAEENVPGARNFAKVTVDDRRPDRAGKLKYVVEGHREPSAYRHCYELGCYDVLVAARRESGLLHLTLDRELERTADNRNQWKNYTGLTPIPDFRERRVELSARGEGSDYKVYRDILVVPTANAPDCEDYPDQDLDRYVCLDLRENLPADRPEMPAALREALPRLVQPKENYELVLAEEFNGEAVDRSGGCVNGMGSLDPSIWNYDQNPCNDQGSLGEECFNVENGYFYMTRTNRCSGGLDTYGKFSYRYGYLETRYTVGFDHSETYLNLAMVQWAGARQARSAEVRHDEYGVVIDSYEALARYHAVEIDHFEYIPKYRRGHDHSHQYMNPWNAIRHANVAPRRTDKNLYFCRLSTDSYALLVRPPGGCSEHGEVTVTKGVEWTPRGYRTFLKVDGVHDEFFVLPESKIELSYRPATVSEDGAVEFGSSWQAYDRDERTSFFEYLIDEDANSILEQFGIAHMPADFEVTAWGYPNKGDDYVRVRLKLDYIRVLQPRDRYSDMEPVYQ